MLGIALREVRKLPEALAVLDRALALSRNRLKGVHV